MELEKIFLSVFTFWIVVLAMGSVVAFRKICRNIHANTKNQPLVNVVKTSKLETLWAGLFSMDTTMLFFIGILAMLQLYPWKVCTELVGENISEMKPPTGMKCFLYILLEVVGSGSVVGMRYRIILEMWYYGTDKLTERDQHKLLAKICTKVLPVTFCLAIIVTMWMVLDYFLNPSLAPEEYTQLSLCWEELSHSSQSATVSLLFAAHAVACTIGYVTYSKYKSIHDTKRGGCTTLVQGGPGMRQTTSDSDHAERMTHFCEISGKSPKKPSHAVDELRNPGTKSSPSWFSLLLPLWAFWAVCFPHLLLFNMGIVNHDVDRTVYLMYWVYGSCACLWSLLLYACLPWAVSR